MSERVSKRERERERESEEMSESVSDSGIWEGLTLLWLVSLEREAFARASLLPWAADT